MSVTHDGSSIKYMLRTNILTGGNFLSKWSSAQYGDRSGSLGTENINSSDGLRAINASRFVRAARLELINIYKIIALNTAAIFHLQNIFSLMNCAFSPTPVYASSSVDQQSRVQFQQTILSNMINLILSLLIYPISRKPRYEPHFGPPLEALLLKLIIFSAWIPFWSCQKLSSKSCLKTA